MPSDAKKKKEATKKAVRKNKDIKGKKPEDDLNNSELGSDNEAPSSPNGNSETNGLKKITSHAKRMVDLEKKLDAMHLVELTNAENRSCTGVLASHPNCRDVHIHQFSLTFYGQNLVVDAKLELNHGRRYGLLGLNGSGKSQVLYSISNRDIPIPAHLDIFHLSREIPATEKTALEAVVECDEELASLEAEAERLTLCDIDDIESQDRLQEIYEQLDDLNADTAETKAAGILHGLGFTAAMQVIIHYFILFIVKLRKIK